MFADCEAPSYAVGVETSDKIARLSHGDLDLALHGDLESAMQRWLNALSPHTMRSYMTGLRQFAEYCYAHNLIQEPTIENAGDFLMALPAGQAKMLSQAWLESLAAVDAKTGRPRYTKATIEVRASALRWAINTAHEQGRIPWTLKLKIPKSAKDPKTGRMVRKKGRNMKGPPLEDIIQMFEVARHNENDAGAGELILSLIFCETLRRHEIMQLDVESVDLRRRTISVIRKKREEDEVLPLSDTTVEAMKRWLEFRGREPGPLLYGFRNDKCLVGQRITESGIFYKVKRLGEHIEIYTTPHRVRHSGITVGDLERERLGLSRADAMVRSGHVSESAHQMYLDADHKAVRTLTQAVGQLIPQHSPPPPTRARAANTSRPAAPKKRSKREAAPKKRSKKRAAAPKKRSKKRAAAAPKRRPAAPKKRSKKRKAK